MKSASTDPTSSDARDVLNSIRQIVRLLRVSSRDSQKKAGLTAAQLFVLRKLSEGGKLSLNDLADRTFTDQSSASVVVGRLAERKLVRHDRSARDRRRLELSLTPAGSALLRKAPPPAQDRLIGALLKLPLARRRFLATTLVEWTALAGIEESPAHLFFEEPTGVSTRPARAAPADRAGIPRPAPRRAK
jgi:DNA-binding MarR family transcriptional regulator